MLSRRSTWKRAVCATALSGLLGVTLTSCSADRFVDENDEGPGPGRACETDRDCKSGRRCIERRCYPDHGDCRSDNDCQDDTACACPPELQSERCACIPWGMKPRDRSDMMCAGAGFTVDEFARLDLSKMDFSEVYAEFTDAARLPDELQATQDMQQKIEDYYARASQ